MQVSERRIRDWKGLETSKGGCEKELSHLCIEIKAKSNL